MTKIKLISIGIAILAVFFGGWQGCNWYRDSLDLAELKATEKALQAFERKESIIANDVNSKLAQLRANERTDIIKVPEIILQPEFVNVCISKDGVDSLNAAVDRMRDNGDSGTK